MQNQNITPNDIPLDEWAAMANEMLALLTGAHVRKKRRTLLKLAEAAYLNVGQAHVFRREDCASKVSHYKWRHGDPAYNDAYGFLVGDANQPGVAVRAREQELDADERLALSALSEARTRLRLATAPAVEVLEDALLAIDKFGPDWRSRISAANSILDRADQETAPQSTLSITAVEDAIAKIYGDDSGHNPANQLPPTAERQPDDSQPASQAHDAYHDRHREDNLIHHSPPSKDQAPGSRPDDPHQGEPDDLLPHDSGNTKPSLIELSDLLPKQRAEDGKDQSTKGGAIGNDADPPAGEQSK